MAEQLNDAWEGDRVARWVEQSEMLEAQLAPVADQLFAAARLMPGESVLDVGCGTGPTTRRAAAIVGARGAVTGLDIASEMLDAAARAPLPEGAAPIEWLPVDAVEWSPPAPGFDAVISRFGVMFFSDPVRAFANLAAGTRPGGRLAITTWARRGESELFAVPFAAALGVLGRDASELPDDAGPFSLCDAGALVAAVEPAGWIDVRAEVRRIRLSFGGGLDPLAAAARALDVGPTRIVTADLDDDTRGRVAAAVADAFTEHLDDDGRVVLGGTILVTTARRGDDRPG
jgi:SAM-dependent methyltransferase